MIFFNVFRWILHFNPLPPHGGRRSLDFSKWRTVHFNPLPPHGGRLYQSLISTIPDGISIHSLRMEGDVATIARGSPDLYFNPLPPHGGRQILTGSRAFAPSISIHSLRMEGDDAPEEKKEEKVNISIHSLRMEGDITLELYLRC